jgi:ribosomal protein S18 acetylase RimI-like enzyme
MLVVRKMRTDDVGRASLLSKEVMVDSWECFEKDYYPKRALEFDLSQHSPENYMKNLEDSTRFNFVAEKNGELVGIAMGVILGTPGLARLGWIGVHPNYQVKGVGKALMQRVIEHCRAKGCHKITLYTLPVLIPAINLYLKFGFVPEAYLRKEWWAVDFIKMSLWLNP